MGMTMAEKILAQHSGREEVSPGEYVWAKIDGTAIGLNTPAQLEEHAIEKFWDPDRVYAVEDHYCLPSSVKAANDAIAVRKIAKKYGLKNFFEYGRHGIAHEIYPHYGYVSPGDLIASVDSHTTSYGCFNVAACSINEEVPYVLRNGQLWFRVPSTIKFEIVGQFPGPDEFIVGMDIMLRILAEHGTDVGLYRSVEFHGSVVHEMSMASRFSIANMAAEMGAKFAIFPCDDKTLAYLDGKMNRPPNPVTPDADARYEAIHQVDVSNISPYIACPHDPSNSVPITEVEGQGVMIDQAFIGSCTSGRLEDFRMAARIMQDREVNQGVRLIATPASQRVWQECLREGIWEIFVNAGALVTHSGCGLCGGWHMGLLGDGEVCISTTNRNFQGRQGSTTASIYLANAGTVAASAVEGKLSNPRRFL